MFDVLGQKNDIEAMDILVDPFISKQERSSFLNSKPKLSNLFIDSLYDLCKEVSEQNKEGLNKYYQIIDQFPNISDKFKLFFKKMLSPNLLEVQFSDTYIVSFPMTFDDSEEFKDFSEIEQLTLTVISILHNYMILLDLASQVMIKSILNFSPVRGALNIGPGILTKHTGTLYGKVLSNVYYLEDNIAQYPRYIISQNIIDWFELCESVADKLLFTNLIRGDLDLIKKLFTKDKDNQFVVDFVFMYYKNPQWVDEIYCVYKYILDAIKYFNRSGNIKLFNRYHCLRKFLQNRMEHHLNIKFDKESFEIVG